MKSITNFIFESLNNEKTIKKLFKPYNIKIGSYGTTHDQFISRNAEYKSGSDKYYFEINADFKNNIFNVVSTNANNDNKSEVYNFNGGKWEIEKVKDFYDGNKDFIKTKIDDISTAFSDENFNVLLEYIKKFCKVNSSKSDQDERLQKVTPKIISLIEKQKNGKSISYNQFIDYVLNIDDTLNKRNQNKIEKGFSKYKFNNFVDISSDDLFNLIIPEEWNPDTDSSIIKLIEIDEEQCITIHKYGEYIVTMISIDLDRPEIYLIK